MVVAQMKTEKLLIVVVFVAFFSLIVWVFFSFFIISTWKKLGSCVVIFAVGVSHWAIWMN